MKILITGGTGLIGSMLCAQLNAHSLFVLTRNTDNKLFSGSNHITPISYIEDVDFNDIDAVINLAGEPIAEKRWNEQQKQLIVQSRLGITQSLVSKINNCVNPPSVFISGSAIGYYGRQSPNLLIDESFEEAFIEFSHELCSMWENEALKTNQNTRVCILRTGIVLSKDGGALKKLLPSFKLGIGSVVADGRQLMSWIHIQDMVKGIIFLLENSTSNGIFNMTAPNAVNNHEFSKTLAAQLQRPCLLSMPAWVMKLLFGEMADLLIYGQGVYPKRLLGAGFNFDYPTLDKALNDLLRKKKRSKY